MPNLTLPAHLSCLTSLCPPTSSPSLQVDQRSGRVTDLVRRQASQRNALTLPRLSGTSTQVADAEGAPAEGSQPGDSAEVAPPPVVVHAVLNPLSKSAQRLAPLIGFVRELLDAEALVLLNPKVCAPVGRLLLAGLLGAAVELLTNSKQGRPGC